MHPNNKSILNSANRLPNLMLPTFKHSERLAASPKSRSRHLFLGKPNNPQLIMTKYYKYNGGKHPRNTPVINPHKPVNTRQHVNTNRDMFKNLETESYQRSLGPAGFGQSQPNVTKPEPSSGKRHAMSHAITTAGPRPIQKRESSQSCMPNAITRFVIRLYSA